MKPYFEMYEIDFGGFGITLTYDPEPELLALSFLFWNIFFEFGIDFS